MNASTRRPLASTPSISVIVPMYQAVSLVAEAFQSIQAQTLPVTVIYAVDDGSTDGSADFAATFPTVQVLRKEHSGLASTLNHGLAQVQTELVAFLDHDDRWVPEKTEWQVAAMRADPGLDMVFGLAQRFISGPEGERIIDVMPGVSKSGGLFRTEQVRKAGGFGGGHDFIDWYARAQEAGLKQHLLDRVVFERRIHARSLGATGKDVQTKSYLTTLKAMLDRRRAMANPDR